MSDNLMSLLPDIKRARDFYLYDDKGNRYLDLYLDNGRAVNGHRPSGLSLALKNTISRGLYAPYPSIYQGRLKKLLQKEFPRFLSFGIYRSYESYLQSEPVVRDFSDPLSDSPADKHMIWRPYLNIPEECSLLKITFPFPGCDVIAVLSDGNTELPPSDPIPPYVLSGVIRSWFDWKKRLIKVVPEFWTIFDETDQWKRRGPYLTPLCSEHDYKKMFQIYLESGVFISPEYNNPSICAVDIREGSLKNLFKKLKEINCG